MAIDHFWLGEIPWVSPKDMKSHVVQDSIDHISEQAIKESATSLIPEGATLMVVRSGILARIVPLALSGRRLTINQDLKALCPGPKINSWYLFYFLHSKMKELIGLVSRGATVHRLITEHIREITIPLPPLPEQQRIIAILDEAFEGIAISKTNAEKNLLNAREVFNGHLHQVFAQRGAGWVDSKKPLSDLCELIVDCEHKTAPLQVEGIPSIRTPNIGKGELLLDGVYRVSEKTYQEWTRRAVPQSGDLIFAREAPAGNVAVIPDNLRVCLGQRTVLIRPNKMLLYPNFIAFLLLSPDIQQKLLDHSRGATVQHVNMKDIRALKFGDLPTLQEQKEIADKLANLSAESENLVSIYVQKLAALDELKQSLLHRAFNGDL